MIRLVIRIAVIATFAIAVQVTSGAGAELVVVASTAPGFAPGTIVDGAQILVLPAGASVTLVSADGGTMMLRGPFADAPGGGSGDGKIVQIIADFLNPERTTTGIATVREIGGNIPVDPYVIAIGRSGAHCVPSDRPLRIWRAAADNATSVTIQRIGNGAEQKVAIPWQAGAATLAWPAELPPTDGSTFFIRLRSATTGTKVTLLVFPMLPTEAHRVAWMIEYGCIRQAKQLISTLR